MSTYNGAKYIRPQLDSIMNQVKVKVSLLIRDDGSKDETIKIIEEYINKYPNNIELVKGNNIGFAASFLTLLKIGGKRNYNYFAFADQDDVWLEYKLFAAVTKIQTLNLDQPALYFSNATAVDEELKYLFDTTKNPLISKETSLVRYFMLGCTMVFNKKLAEIISENTPINKILMHDLWLNQTSIFFGNIIFDSESYILYRQHNNNVAGVGSSLNIRLRRFIKSFKKYERRHFREINAKNLLIAYDSLLLPKDRELIELVAYYRSSLKRRILLLFNRKIIDMGSYFSDTVLRIRILLGLF
ncbi:MAG: glycosyltransferase [Bacteroides sp.]|nr:glycosyltransferase [Bacteroides sp.]